MKRILVLILCFLVVPSFALAKECISIDHDDGMTYTFCYEVDRGTTGPPTVKLVFEKMEPTEPDTITSLGNGAVIDTSIIFYTDEPVIRWNDLDAIPDYKHYGVMYSSQWIPCDEEMTK